MTTNLTEWTDTLIHLHALASRLEGEGQYNLAKLARAAADALCRQAAYQQPLPSDSRQLAADISLTAEALSRLDASACSGVKLNKISTLCACACLRTLANASWMMRKICSSTAGIKGAAATSSGTLSVVAMPLLVLNCCSNAPSA